MIAPNVSSTAALVPADSLRRLLSDPPGGIIDRLVAANKITTPDYLGRINVVEVLPAFFAELRTELRASTATAASERSRLARAASAELRLSEARRELIEVEDASQAVDHLVGAILTALSSLSARITRDVPTRRRAEAALYKVQSEVARELDRMTG